MGLDNGFVGHFKRHPEVKMELAYFRKYYTLNDWVMKHGTVAGHKLIKLYRNVLCMLEMIEENGDDFYITFYSSF